jgi:hypothetical protein
MPPETGRVLMNRENELGRLQLADRLIARAEAAVMQQIADLDQRRVGGYDMALAERRLRAFANSLDALKDRRELIAMTMRQLDHGDLTPTHGIADDVPVDRTLRRP